MLKPANLVLHYNRRANIPNAALRREAFQVRRPVQRKVLSFVQTSIAAVAAGIFGCRRKRYACSAAESIRPVMATGIGIRVFEMLQVEADSLRKTLGTIHPQSPETSAANVGVLGIDGPAIAPIIVDLDDELCTPTPDEGPWEVYALLAGILDDPIYGGPIRVRLRFSLSWPSDPPMVRVLGLRTFPLLDARNRAPPPAFYEQLLKRAQVRGKVLDLETVLRELRFFLLDPLGYLGLEHTDATDDVQVRRAKAWVRDARRLNENRSHVIQQYSSMVRHPALFDPVAPLQADWFDTIFWTAHENGSSSAWQTLLEEHLPGKIYSMPLFTSEFCDMLVEEIFNFYASGLPARRPNSMNNYGIIVSDIGLEHFVDKLQVLLQPLGRFLFPGAGSAWDEHHCFIVRYREGEDLGLDMHTDDSDVTVNVCLGINFTGAGLQFCGMMGDPSHRKHSFTYQHMKGRAVMHLGRQRHGADDIASGERLNLILWNTSSEYRRSKDFRTPVYLKEAAPPEAICVSYTHDRDFGMFKPYPKGKESFKKNSWCPPPSAEYEGFRSDRADEDITIPMLAKL